MWARVRRPRMSAFRVWAPGALRIMCGTIDATL
jgi:hypothetical protein